MTEDMDRLPNRAFDPKDSDLPHHTVNPAVNYDWVFFDWGGTLTAEPIGEEVQPKPVNATGRALLQWFELLGHKLPYTEQEMEDVTAEAHVHTPGRQGQRSVRANREYCSRWLAWIYRRVGIERVVSLSELECCHAFYLWKAIGDYARPFGEVTTRTLRRLDEAGIRIGAISNNSGYVEDLLLNAGVRDLFGIVVDSRRVEYVKPEYQIFDLAARLTGDPSQRFLYVGDSFEADVVGATGAGWDVAWICDPQDDRELPLGRVYRIQSLGELIPICLPGETE